MKQELEDQIIESMEKAEKEVISIIEQNDNPDDAEKLLLELNDNMIMQYAAKTYDLLPKFMELSKDEFISLQQTINVKQQEVAKKIIESVMQKILAID